MPHTPLHMDTAREIPDSTDWLSTPLSGLSALENALHCQICKEFFDTPMITSCSHTFCSKCIRTALSTDGSCPACRKQDQASKLRNNWQLQEIVATFLEARPATIRVARDHRAAVENAASRPRKRKRDLQAWDDMPHEEGTGRVTRSKSQRIAGSQASQSGTIGIDDSEESDVFVPEEPLDDGLVECPLGCGKRMKIEQVDPHLDRCEQEKEAGSRATSRRPAPRPGLPSRDTSRPQDRLNELNYSMMKDRELTRRLKDQGIPSWGTKQLMTRRHTVWVNIWNANCDSNRPRTKRELLRELDEWERTQGGSAPTATNGIMKKDFDGDGWSRKNQDEFSTLIENARQSRVKAAVKAKEVMAAEASAKLVTPEDPTNDEVVKNDGPTATPSQKEGIVPSEGIASFTPLAHHPNDDTSPAEVIQPRPLSAQTPSQSADHLARATPHVEVMAQTHFGHESENREREQGGPLHFIDDHGAPRETTADHHSVSVRKMPMFAMQAQPMKDLDGASMGGGQGG